jgi:predicted dehydrogenase
LIRHQALCLIILQSASTYDYQNYDSLADNPQVQALYIALPNTMYAEYMIRGAQAGKHILCEKPMAMNVAECRQMIAACRQAERKLMIAYRSPHEPTNRAVVRMVATGASASRRNLSPAIR